MQDGITTLYISTEESGGTTKVKMIFGTKIVNSSASSSWLLFTVSQLQQKFNTCPKDDTIILVKSLVNAIFGIAYAVPVGTGTVLC